MEVIKWRVDPEIKMALESEAHSEGMTLAQMLNHIAKHWLETRKQQNGNDEAEQARLHAAAAKSFGTIAAGPNLSENVSAKLRTALKERSACER